MTEFIGKDCIEKLIEQAKNDTLNKLLTTYEKVMVLKLFMQCVH